MRCFGPTFTLLSLIGLIGIAAEVVRRRSSREDSLLDAALGFTAVASALWILVSLLIQR